MKEIIKWTIFILPLRSLLFINKPKVWRFLPVSLFVTLINTLFYQAAYHYNWWKEASLFECDKYANVHWVYSAYLVATIWIFSITYGNFIKYFITNAVLDAIYAYLWYPLLGKLGLASGEFSNTGNYVLMLLVALLIYLFQIWYEKGASNCF